MNWNRYNITTPGGFKYECVIGEWLKPGKYSFGEVEIIGRIGDGELKEYFDAEHAIYDMWHDEVLSEVECR